MKANVILNTHSEAEAQRHEAQLEKNGYKVIANCYWKVIFQKADGWTVQVNREF